MKSKLSKIFGLGFAIMLLSSLLVAGTPVPVSAGTLSLSDTDLMGATGEVVAAVDVDDLAVAGDGTTIYAVTGSTVVYKSTDQGASWTKLTVVADMAATLVAVAPDNASIVAVGNTSAVYVSTDGASTFKSLGAFATIGAGRLVDIDISAARAGVRALAAAGDTGTGATAVDYFELGETVALFKAAGTANAEWGSNPSTVNGTARAVKFSPNYASDRTLIMVSENSTGSVFINIANFASKQWNATAGFTDYDGTKNLIFSNAGSVPLQKASISPLPTYLAADESSRVAIVGIDTKSTDATGSGMYRMKDEEKKLIGDQNRIWSVAITSGNKLVAGAGSGTSTVVYRSSDPLATTPTVDEASLYQRPGGTANVTLAWAKDKVVAASQGNESAFAVSKDGGVTFNDISLVNTTLTNLQDVALSADGKLVYLISDDGTDTSIWRHKDGADAITGWERVLSVKASVGNGYQVRRAPAPDDAKVAYLFKKGALDMFYTNDAGETRWDVRVASANVVDLAVESAAVLYSLDAAGIVYKSTNAAFVWETGVVTKLGDGATIVSLSKDNLIVGGATGFVAYSTNGNVSWTKLDNQIDGISDKVQVTASGLKSGDRLFAVTNRADKKIYYWILGKDTEWDNIIDAKLGSGQKGTGIALSGGVLYVTSTNGSDNNSILWRALDPLNATGDNDAEEWSSVTKDVVLDRTPSALRAGKGAVWAVDTRATPDALDNFKDKLTDPLKVISPKDKAVIDINTATGVSYDVLFSWERPDKKVTDYDLEIAQDAKFTQIFGRTRSMNLTTGDIGAPQAVAIGPSASILLLSGGQGSSSYQPSTTYYWRARVARDGPVFSPWSKALSFTIASSTKFAIVSPAAGAINVPVQATNFVWTEVPGAKGYELMVAQDPTFAIIDFSHTATNTFFVSDETLKFAATYYWRVRAVGGPWANGVFTTAAEPVPPAPPVVITPPSPPQVVQVPVPTPAPVPSYLLWAIVGIGAILVIALIVLIVRTRRVV